MNERRDNQMIKFHCPSCDLVLSCSDVPCLRTRGMVSFCPRCGRDPMDYLILDRERASQATMEALSMRSSMLGNSA